MFVNAEQNTGVFLAGHYRSGAAIMTCEKQMAAVRHLGPTIAPVDSGMNWPKFHIAGRGLMCWCFTCFEYRGFYAQQHSPVSVHLPVCVMHVGIESRQMNTESCGFHSLQPRESEIKLHVLVHREPPVPCEGFE